LGHDGLLMKVGRPVFSRGKRSDRHDNPQDWIRSIRPHFFLFLSCGAAIWKKKAAQGAVERTSYRWQRAQIGVCPHD
jgi:hypothetical protein